MVDNVAFTWLIPLVPMTECTTETVETDFEPCGLGRRLLAMLYDALVLVAILLLATALALLAGSGAVTAGRDPFFTLYLVLVWFLYLALCWRLGMTVGMRAWRIRIKTSEGGKPGWAACLVRFVVSLLAAAPAGLGFWWSLFDPGRRTWHDIASGTCLVRR